MVTLEMVQADITKLTARDMLEEAASIMVRAARAHEGGLEQVVLAVRGADAGRAFEDALAEPA